MEKEGSPSPLCEWAHVLSLSLHRAHAGRTQSNAAKASRTVQLTDSCLHPREDGPCMRQTQRNVAKI